MCTSVSVTLFVSSFLNSGHECVQVLYDFASFYEKKIPLYWSDFRKFY